MSAAVFLFATPIMQMFVGKESTEVIFLGVTYLKLISIMYIMPAATNIIQGFFRGMGDLKITLISTITNMSFRFLSAYLFIRIWGGGVWKSCLGKLLGLDRHDGTGSSPFHPSPSQTSKDRYLCFQIILRCRDA